MTPSPVSRTATPVRNAGLRVPAPEVAQRLRAVEPVAPSDCHFRATPRFEAPHGPQAWLNDRMFVASPAPAAGSVTIDVYEGT
ncbi:MAG: DUF3237 family protein [Mesorhizobium sp.]|nr:DUF3237 family protein [Mesorhizobium sp.]